MYTTSILALERLTPMSVSNLTLATRITANAMVSVSMQLDSELEPDTGSGSHLPPVVLTLATFSSLFATFLSFYTIWLQLKNYRKVMLQRFVVRILVMVPIYSLTSLISLYSLSLAFYLDAIRDLYEAFVIYCFFSLLVSYLGGDRSLLQLLHGRPPIPHPPPFNRFLHPMDPSDPYTFLSLRRGILQYVYVKPVLALATMFLKVGGTYKDGSIELGSGYTYVSIVYNFSVCLSLYCLGMFWAATNSDLRPFRPVPKFLCVKGIIFFSFWQGLFISILVALGLLTSPNYTSETLGLAATDTLMCLEMPLFAILHLYAFSHTDYIPSSSYSARLPLSFALRDSLLGYKDVVADSLTAWSGTGISYRTFEPAEGQVHVGVGRQRRIRAGLRYTEGGRGKYWMPMPGSESEVIGNGNGIGTGAGSLGAGKKLKQAWNKVASKVGGGDREGYAPLMQEQAEEVFRRDRREEVEGDAEGEQGIWMAGEGEEEESLEFEDVGEEEEMIYKDSRKLEFGDYNYPCVDASKEDARKKMREEEERMWGGNMTPSLSPSLMKGRSKGKIFEVGNGVGDERRESIYGRLAEDESNIFKIAEDEQDAKETDMVGKTEAKKDEERLPDDCVDLLVEDQNAEDEERTKERLKGEPAMVGMGKKIFKRPYVGSENTNSSASGSGSRRESMMSTPASARIGNGGQSERVVVEDKKERTVMVDKDYENGRIEKVEKRDDNEMKEEERKQPEWVRDWTNHHRQLYGNGQARFNDGFTNGSAGASGGFGRREDESNPWS